MSKVTVEGQVVGSFSKGLRLLEEQERNGQTYSQRWSLWTDERHPDGTQVTVEGFLSAKGNLYTKTGATEPTAGVDLSINSPRITVTSSPAEQQAPVDEPWVTAPAYENTDWNQGAENVPF